MHAQPITNIIYSNVCSKLFFSLNSKSWPLFSTDADLFNHFTLGGHHVCFQLLPIINSAYSVILVQTSFFISLFL